MEQISINRPKLRVHVKTGSEGPRHDPYAYREVTVKTPRGKTVLHEGLGTWLSHNGHTFKRRPKGMTYEQWEAWLRTDKFVKLTGHTIQQLERIHRRLEGRCRKCGGRDFTWESGYPGEELQVCTACDRINGSTFDRSAIE